MTSGTEAYLATLRTELAQLRTDFAKITSTLQDLARHGKAAGTAKAQDSAQCLQEEVARRAQNVTQFIEEKPVASALTTFAIGMLLGTLRCRRRVQ